MKLFIKKQKGFTIIEAMAVVGVICLILAIVLPLVFSNDTQIEKLKAQHNATEVFRSDSLRVYSFTYKGRNYLVNNQGGLVEASHE